MDISEHVVGSQTSGLNAMSVILQNISDATAADIQAHYLDDTPIDYIGEQWRILNMDMQVVARNVRKVGLSLALYDPYIVSVFVQNEGAFNEIRTPSYSRRGQKIDKPNWPPRPVE